MNIRPVHNEYAPYYAGYVSLVPDGEIETILIEQEEETIILLKNLTEDQALFRYAPDKWTIKEIIGHLVDTEQYLKYRLFCIARGEKALLPGHDESLFVKEGQFNRFTVEELLEQFSIIRKGTISLIKTLRSDVWTNWGNANGYDVTVRGLAYIIAGHELHHRKIITDRYFNFNNFPISK